VPITGVRVKIRSEGEFAIATLWIDDTEMAELSRINVTDLTPNDPIYHDWLKIPSDMVRRCVERATGCDARMIFRAPNCGGSFGAKDVHQ
jgi:hypothetical protein